MAKLTLYNLQGNIMQGIANKNSIYSTGKTSRVLQSKSLFILQGKIMQGIVN